LLDVEPLTKVDDTTWHVSGMMSLRRLAKQMEVELPEAGSVTLGGAMQEVLQKLCEADDRCQWGPFDLRVLDTDTPSGLLVELRMTEQQEEES
jgi:CBS domain containing-hemolysin-like protein